MDDVRGGHAVGEGNGSVRIAHGEAGGSVTLGYQTLEQLDMLCQRLTGEGI